MFPLVVATVILLTGILLYQARDAFYSGSGRSF
jgi:hypothetical protein